MAISHSRHLHLRAFYCGSKYHKVNTILISNIYGRCRASIFFNNNKNFCSRIMIILVIFSLAKKLWAKKYHKIYYMKFMISLIKAINYHLSKTTTRGTNMTHKNVKEIATFHNKAFWLTSLMISILWICRMRVRRNFLVSHSKKSARIVKMAGFDYEMVNVLERISAT